MELVNSYNVNSSDYPDNRRMLLKEAFESDECGLAIMRSMRNADGEIVDFAYKAVNPIAKCITGCSEELEQHTLLSSYPGPRGRDLMEKFSQVMGSMAPAYFGTVLGNDGNVWSAAGLAYDDEVIIIYTNLSDYGLIKKLLRQTTITVEVQNAIRNEQNEVLGYEMYFITDVSGNRHAASRFLVCRKLMQMFPVSIVRACMDDLKHVLESESYIQVKEYYGAEGLKTWVKNSVVKFKNNGIITFIDLSGVSVQPGVPQSVLVQLRRANRELDELAKIVAHDLKEPLRKIATFYSMLEEVLDEPEKREKYSQTIHYIIHGLQVKLDDLLLYLQIENELIITDVDMNDTLRRVLFSLEYRKFAQAPVISVASLPVVKADANMMFMLFQSLMANAIEFKTVGQLKVQVDCKIEDDNYRFCIKDNGMGIEEEYSDKVFGLFQRLDPDSYGTGLGLAVCRKIIELHGGKIWLESKTGEGTTFYISLPKR